MHHHSIKDIVDLGHTMLLLEQGRGDHAQDLAVVHTAGLADELDVAAHQPGGLYIGCGDPGNALGKDLVQRSFAWKSFPVSLPNLCVYCTASTFTSCGVFYIRHESLQEMSLISF